MCLGYKPSLLALNSQPKPRVAAKPPSYQHKTTVLDNQPARSTNEAFLNVQVICYNQSFSREDDRPIPPLGASDNNKVIYKVSAHYPPSLVQKDTTNLRTSSRVSKSNRKYIDIGTSVLAHGLKSSEVIFIV